MVPGRDFEAGQYRYWLRPEAMEALFVLYRATGAVLKLAHGVLWVLHASLRSRIK